jgi:hypothetical protein
VLDIFVHSFEISGGWRPTARFARDFLTCSRDLLVPTPRGENKASRGMSPFKINLILTACQAWIQKYTNDQSSCATCNIYGHTWDLTNLRQSYRSRDRPRDAHGIVWVAALWKPKAPVEFPNVGSKGIVDWFGTGVQAIEDRFACEPPPPKMPKSARPISTAAPTPAQIGPQAAAPPAVASKNSPVGSVYDSGLLPTYAYPFHVCGFAGSAPAFSGSGPWNRPCAGL